MEFLDLPQLLSATGTVRLPGSKSISNRVLLLAALAEGETEVRDLLASDDTGRMLDALKALGVGITHLGGENWLVKGCGGRFPVRQAELFLGNAGTAFRPLTAALALAGGDYILEGVAPMHERPIGDLVDGLGLARSKSGQQYFPFLDNIVNGKITLREIDDAKDDSLLYYQLLVRSQMDYVARAINKDTPFEFKSLTRRLEDKAKADFVNIINGLHNERNPDIRFRRIQPLNAQELYYLAVSSDGSIYTSSFVKGVYPLMMKKINFRGDSLLMLLNFDKYRKFIKMTAGFNTLDKLFLASFTKSDQPCDEDPANTLMRAFVKNLEKRGSRKFLRILLSNKTIGPQIMDYKRGKGMTMKTKVIAIAMVLVSMSISAFVMVKIYWVKWAICLTCIGVVAIIFKQKTRIAETPLNGIVKTNS